MTHPENSTTPGTALTLPAHQALQQDGFPARRVAARLGLDPDRAGELLHRDDVMQQAVRSSVQQYREALQAERGGHPVPEPLATDPDFPVATGQALVGAVLLWEVHEELPPLALAVARELYDMGETELASSYLSLAQQYAEPDRDDEVAWAAQSLLAAVLTRAGASVQAQEVAADLAAHGIDPNLWQQDDPRLPDDSMAWHGGAFVGGIPPRRDERHLSVEDVQDYLAQLLRETSRTQDVESSSDADET